MSSSLEQLRSIHRCRRHTWTDLLGIWFCVDCPAETVSAPRGPGHRTVNERVAEREEIARLTRVRANAQI